MRKFSHMKPIRLFYETFGEDDRYEVIPDSVSRAEKFRLGYDSFSDRELDQMFDLVKKFKQENVRKYNFISDYKQIYCQYRITDNSFSIEIDKNTDEWFFIKIEVNSWALGSENLVVVDLMREVMIPKMFGPPENNQFIIKCV